MIVGGHPAPVRLFGNTDLRTTLIALLVGG